MVVESTEIFIDSSCLGSPMFFKNLFKKNKHAKQGGFCHYSLQIYIFNIIGDIQYFFLYDLNDFEK